LYIKFVQSILRVFNSYIQNIKVELISAFKLIDMLSNLIHNMENRKNEHLINSEMVVIINALEKE